MDDPRHPSRDAVERLADLSARYRSAFVEVQDCLARAEMGRIPAWVFAVERLPIEDVAALSEELAAAESRRRSLRVALHALIELIALEDDEGRPADGSDVDHLVTAMSDAEDDGAQKQLDRFISVINYAKSGGCIYVNGTFEPVARVPQVTADSAKPTEPIPSAVPKGDDIALPEPAVLRAPDESG